MIDETKKKYTRIKTFLDTCLNAIPRFCVEGLPKILDFGYFVFTWWQTDKKQEKDLFIWTELPIVWKKFLDTCLKCYS